MKKRLLYSILCAILIVLSASAAISQSIETDSIMSSKDFFNSDDFINLSKGDKSKDVSIMVEKGTLKLTLQMGSIVNLGGMVSFDIFDPNGKKQDGFALSNTGKGLVVVMDILDKDYVTSNRQLQSIESYAKIENSSKTKGHFLREFTNPLSGTWVITATPLNYMDGKFKINHIITMK